MLYGQCLLERAHGAVLPDDDLVGLQFCGRLEWKRLGVARPSQLLGQKTVRRAQVTLSHGIPPTLHTACDCGRSVRSFSYRAQGPPVRKQAMEQSMRGVAGK